MKPNEPLAFGDMVRQRMLYRHVVMVVEPKVKRDDAGGGWFTGILVRTQSTSPLIVRYVGEIGYYQRTAMEKVE